jgi:uncharacterized integral membrane protein
MRNLKRVSLAVFLLMLALAILVFILENQQSVALQYLGWAGPRLPMSAITLIALLIGMLIGPCISWLLGQSSRVRRKNLA